MRKELLIGIGIGAVVVALFTGANASSLLFGLLVLACPLMMFFMMGGHDRGDRPDSDTAGLPRQTEKPRR